MKNGIIWLLICGFAGLLGCTSDKHFEKYFSRNGGIWDIKMFKWQRVANTITTQDIRQGETTNAGYLKFEDSGNCSFSHSLDTLNRTGIAVWSAQDEQIQLVYDSVAGAAPATMIVSLRIDKNGANKATLQGTENWNDDIGGSYSNNLSYELERRD